MSRSAPSPHRSYRIRIEPTADGGGRSPELSPREARDRWLAKIRASSAESTVSSYHYRTKHFIEWCEENGVSSTNQLTGWEIDEFENYRRGQGLALISLNNELSTLKNFLEYCARVELVDENLPSKVVPPEVPTEADVDDTRLPWEDGRELLNHYENAEELRHSRAHVLLTLGWYAGPPRLGAIRGLDIRDYHPDEQYIRYHHRPDEDTPLKNEYKGERVVRLPERAIDVIEGYLDEHRHDIRDDYGRQPLLTSQVGRPSRNAIRAWMYLATVPCVHSECPHGNDPSDCEFLDYSKASQCPSSRSPHQVRTGAITWMLNEGVSIDTVAARANVSVSVLKKHYDKPGHVEEMMERRSNEIDDWGFGDAGGGDQ
jgi:site-specific recombinase XerD